MYFLGLGPLLIQLFPLNIVYGFLAIRKYLMEEKMSKVLTIGEAMGLLIAEEMGPLEEVEFFPPCLRGGTELRRRHGPAGQ
jgi:hypothetical protein